MRDRYLAHISQRHPRIWALRLDWAAGVALAFWLLCLTLPPLVALSSKEIQVPSDADADWIDNTLAGRGASPSLFIYYIMLELRVPSDADADWIDNNLARRGDTYYIFNQIDASVRRALTVSEAFAQLSDLEPSLGVEFLSTARAELGPYLLRGPRNEHLFTASSLLLLGAGFSFLWLWKVLRSMRLPHAPALAGYPGFLTLFLPLLVINGGSYAYVYLTGLVGQTWGAKALPLFLLGGQEPLVHVDVGAGMWGDYAASLLVPATAAYVALFSLIGYLCGATFLLRATMWIVVSVILASLTAIGASLDPFYTFTAIPIIAGFALLTSLSQRRAPLVTLLGCLTLLASPWIWWAWIRFVCNDDLEELCGAAFLLLSLVFILIVRLLTRIVRRAVAAPS